MKIVLLKRTGPAAFVSAFAIAAAAVSQESGATDPRIAEAAPVLARIVEKKLAAAATPLRSLQWTRIPGRGLLFLADLDSFQPELLDADRDWTPEELAWENARRELGGRSPIVPGHAVMTRNALRGVQDALARFAERVPLADGETSRFVLYSRQGAGTCATCHDTSLSSGFPRSSDIPGFDIPGFGHSVHTAHSVGESPPGSFVAVDRQEVWQNADSPAALDAAVLARVLGQRLAESFPDEFWGKDVHGRPGALGVLAGDWGPTVILNMTFPIATDSDGAARPPGDLWDQTVRELRGEDDPATASGYEVPGSQVWRTAVTRRQSVDAEALLGSVRETLAAFAPRVELQEDQAVTVLVYGGRASVASAWKREGPSRRQNGSTDVHDVVLTQQHPRSLYASPQPDYVLVLAGADIRAHRAGTLTREQLSERIRLTVTRS